MNKRFLFIVLIIILTISITRIYSQQVSPSGTVKVLAVKGSVVCNGEKLKKGDKFEFKSNVDAMNQLGFSNTSDWIKVVEMKTKKVHQYYKQKKYTCTNCLFTRGMFSNNTSKIDLHEYFSGEPIILPGLDTIILRTNNINKNSDNIAIFQIIIKGKTFDRVVGNSDTIMISRDCLFGFADEEKILWPSFQTDSIKLIYYNRATHEQFIPNLPYFQVRFIDDAVHFFLNMKMDSDEIYNELIENYIDLKYLAINKGFSNLKDTSNWLKEYIETLLSKSDR